MRDRRADGNDNACNNALWKIADQDRGVRVWILGKVRLHISLQPIDLLLVYVVNPSGSDHFLAMSPREIDE